MLEVVEVDEEHRELPAGAVETRHGMIHPVTEQRLVREPRQGIVERLTRQLLLEDAVLGDVAEAPDAPDDLAVDALWERVAFEDSAVDQLELVVALRLGSS